MFENIFQTSIFVQVLVFAIVSVLTLNIIAAVINGGLMAYMKVRKIK